MSKPTVAIVPGAWHSPSHYQSFIDSLNQAGFPTASKRLPSVGSDEPNQQSVATDAAFIRQNVLLPEVEQGRDVILAVHSYGGLPGDASAKGLSKAERAGAGLSGGVIAIIFVCAFLGIEGQSLLDKAPDHKTAPWARVDHEVGQIEVEAAPTEIFYNKVENQAFIEKATRELKLQSYQSFDTPCPPTAYTDEAFDGRRVYVFCHQDKAIPIGIQQYMVTASGKEWLEFHLEDSDHSPFASDAEGLVKIVEEVTQKAALL